MTGPPVADPNARFVGSIPENYDRYLGPVLFEPYARDLARRVPAGPGTRVLEVACGTGILTRRLRERLPDTARVTATDLNAPMIDHARRSLADVPGIDWRQADFCALPFDDRSFDVLVSQFGLMFVPDKPAALKEARRVLARGGILLLNVWDSLERNRFALMAQRVIEDFCKVDPPTFYQVPFSLHDVAEIRRLVEGAGFKDVHIDAVALASESPAAADLARGLIEGNPVGPTLRERGLDAEALIRGVALALATDLGDRPVKVPLHAFVVMARV